MRQGTKRYRCWAVSVALLVGVSGRGTLSWGQMPGELTQLLGFDGCIAEVGGATCTDGRALGDPLGSGAVTIKVWRCGVEPGHEGPPGMVLDAGPEGILVACGSGALRVIELQREGGRRMLAR